MATCSFYFMAWLNTQVGQLKHKSIFQVVSHITFIHIPLVKTKHWPSPQSRERIKHSPSTKRLYTSNKDIYNVITGEWKTEAKTNQLHTRTGISQNNKSNEEIHEKLLKTISNMKKWIQNQNKIETYIYQLGTKWKVKQVSARMKNNGSFCTLLLRVWSFSALGK